MSSYGAVTVEKVGHVARVLIDNPPSNHVSAALLRDLAEVLESLDADEGVRALVLVTGGRVFCGGADLVGTGSSAIGGPADVSQLYEQAMRIFSNTKPIVAGVQGAAVGAGLGLALAADFRVAGPEARFAANFVKLGFHAGFAISHTLPRLIGAQRAALMLLTGRRLKAPEALACGLVDEVAIDPGEAALIFAQEIAAAAPLAVQSTRSTLRAGLVAAVRETLRHELAEQTRLMETADFREGVQSVAERRSGRFTGS